MATLKKHWILITVVVVVGYYLYTQYGTALTSGTPLGNNDPSL